MRVITLIIRRLVVSIPTILGITLVVFLLLLVMPGNPAELIQGRMANPRVTEALIERWGLDRPPLVRLARWGRDIIQLDLGRSLATGRPVSEMLAPRLAYSSYLGILGLLLGAAIGIPAGILSAVRPNSLLDYLATLLALLGISLPGFVIGLLLQLAFGLYWPILPISGAPDSIWQLRGLRFAVLPALSVGAYQAAINARVVRTTMLEVVNEWYIQTARSKGFSEVYVILKHAVPNVLIALVTLLGVYVRSIISGILIIEIVFGWPGVGTLFYEAVRYRDYPVIQGVTLVIAIGVFAANLLVDLVYAYLDPRIRVEGAVRK